MGSFCVTIRANNVTLFDLCEKFIQIKKSNEVGDGSNLHASDMIEFHDIGRMLYAAISARKRLC